MLLSTSSNLERKYKVLGLVRGNTVRSRHIGADILAALKNIVGGELKGYTKMISSARDEATERMIAEAKKLKADAIIEIRYTAGEAAPGTVEILAYGTA